MTLLLLLTRLQLPCIHTIHTIHTIQTFPFSLFDFYTIFICFSSLFRKCEITREKSRNGKTAWKIESSNLNRITFRYSSIPYRLAWKEPSYLFALKFPSIFGDDGPNAVLTSGDETVVFFINKVEYEFDEETKTSKQVYEIEQSEEQEEVSPLSGLLGETSDGKTFEHCKYFIDDGGTSALISDNTRFAKIRNTLKIALASKEIHEAAPESSPSGITGSSVSTQGFPPFALLCFGVCRIC